MVAIRSIFTAVLQRLPHRHQQRSQPYESSISTEDLTGEYLMLRIPPSPSPDVEAAVTTLLTETNRNGFAGNLTDSEGYPSLFPPGASRFDASGSTSRLQDLVSVLDRFTQVFQDSETGVIVINTARIQENVRIAEHDPSKSGRIARQNVDALADCLAALPEENRQFVDSDAVPATARDRHLVNFQESFLYR